MSRFAGTGGTRAAVEYGKVRHDGIWRIEGESGGTIRGVCARLVMVWGRLVSSSHYCSGAPPLAERLFVGAMA